MFQIRSRSEQRIRFWPALHGDAWYFVFTLYMVLMLSLTSCGVLKSDKNSFVLFNSGNLPLIALAVESITSESFDPELRFDIMEGDERIIAPGASHTFTNKEVLGGYRKGQDVRIFLYEISNAEAVLIDVRTLSRSELAEEGFNVKIPF